MALAQHTSFLLTLAASITPGLRVLDASQQQEVLAIVEQAIAARPPALRRQLAVFLFLMQWAPVLRYGRPFGRLDPTRQEAVLRWLLDTPVRALRHGFWGVKTLIFMGYYGHPEVSRRIGYRPERDGNSLLHAR